MLGYKAGKMPRKFSLVGIALSIAVALMISLVSGCGLGGVKVYSDPGQAITVRVDQQFIITLESNPTTGYQWKADFDQSLLRLVGSKFESSEQEGAVGAGGKQSFTFQGLDQGQTCVTLGYQRPQEERPVDEKVFTVNIK